MFTLLPRRQRRKKAYPHTGLSPSLANATAGASARRTGKSIRKSINRVSEIGKKNIELTYQIYIKKSNSRVKHPEGGI